MNRLYKSRAPASFAGLEGKRPLVTPPPQRRLPLALGKSPICCEADSFQITLEEEAEAPFFGHCLCL